MTLLGSHLEDYRPVRTPALWVRSHAMAATTDSAGTPWALYSGKRVNAAGVRLAWKHGEEPRLAEQGRALM